LDAGKEETYDLLFSLYREISQLFPDNCIHIGGNDVDLECWEENAETSKQQEFWDSHKMSKPDGFAIADFYVDQVTNMVLRNQQTPMLWLVLFKSLVPI
jgi:hexosaminidase